MCKYIFNQEAVNDTSGGYKCANVHELRVKTNQTKA